MLKLAVAAVTAAVVATAGVSFVKNGAASARSAVDNERLLDMPVCEEVVVTAVRPGWIIEEVISVARVPDPGRGDSNVRSPWLYETEVAGRPRVLPTAVN